MIDRADRVWDSTLGKSEGGLSIIGAVKIKNKS